MNKFKKPPLLDKEHPEHPKKVKNITKVLGVGTGIGALALGLGLTGHNSLPSDAKTVSGTETLMPGTVLRSAPFEDPSNGDYVTTVPAGEKIVITNAVEVKNPLTVNGDVFNALVYNGQTVYVDVTQVNKQSLEEGKNYIIDSPANSTNYLPTKVEGNHYVFQDPNTGKWQEAGQSVTISNNN